MSMNLYHFCMPSCCRSENLSINQDEVTGTTIKTITREKNLKKPFSTLKFELHKIVNCSIQLSSIEFCFPPPTYKLFCKSKSLNWVRFARLFLNKEYPFSWTKSEWNIVEQRSLKVYPFILLFSLDNKIYQLQV